MPAILKAVSQTELQGECLSLRTIRLAVAFIRTSYTMSRDGITLCEFLLIYKARSPLIFSHESSLPNKMRCFHCISRLFCLSLAKLVLVKTQLRVDSHHYDSYMVLFTCSSSFPKSACQTPKH